jgi:hypothetical protein
MPAARSSAARGCRRLRIFSNWRVCELAGLGEGLRFEYRHYGPYSEALADAMRAAYVFDLVSEQEKLASWGGTYSIYTALPEAGTRVLGDRARFAETAASIDSIELELAATAAYLAVEEGSADPGDETARRKPEKVGDGRLERAKQAYGRLRSLKVPRPLPELP